MRQGVLLHADDESGTKGSFSHAAGKTPSLVFQQSGQHSGQRIGLGEHGRGGLGKNLIAGELSHFRRHVRIGDARFRGLQIFGLDGGGGDGVFQAVPGRTDVRADRVFFDNGTF